MKKTSGYFLVLLVAAVALYSCKGNADYRKTKSGLMYKIIGDSKDSALKEGSIIKFNYQVKIGSNDSVLNSTYNKMPAYVRVDAAPPQDAYSPIEVFGQLHKGDSLIVVQFVDSLLKRSPGQQMPPFLKKGDKILSTFKVLNIYKSQEDASADRTAEVDKERARMQKEVEVDLVKEDQEMQAYLTKNNIKAQKVGKGSYLVLTDPGTGMQADSGKYVTIRYSGKLISTGKEFESTMDPNSQPYTFMIGSPTGSIKGMDDAMRLFKKGGKGTMYIPGALAYGKNPPPNSPFKENEPLMFDVVLVDVSDTAPAQQMGPQQLPPQVREQLQKEMQRQQQQKKPVH